MSDDKLNGRDTNVPTTEDCISREEAINRIETIEPTSTISDYQKGIAVGFALAKKINPRAKTAHRKTGHWIGRFSHQLSSVSSNVWICSECDSLVETAHYAYRCYYKFCPYCGAKMESEVG